MNSRKMQRRLDRLVDDGLGEWLIRAIASPLAAADLVDYEGHTRRLAEQRKAAAVYQRRRLRCVAKYRREGRDRRSGVLMQTNHVHFSVGGTQPEDNIRIGEGEARAVHVQQPILTPGKTYRVRGQHRSELTGGWVDVMDCDHNGQGGIRSPTIPKPGDYVDFDDLAVYETEPPPPLRVECRNKQLPPLEPAPEGEWMEDGDMEATGSVEIHTGPVLTGGARKDSI